MRGQKSNIGEHPSFSRISNINKSTNVMDLIKRNKEEEKKEKIQKIYIKLSFIGLLFLIIIFRYL